MIPTDLIDLLENTWTSTSELGAQLTEAQWKSPSELPGWTVQDTLSHLLGGERMMQRLPPTTHVAAAADHVKNPIGANNENDVDERRSWSGAQVLTEWNEITALRIRTLRDADDAYFAVEAMTPTGPGTVADFLHIRIMDCWLHEQEMRRVTGISGNESGDCAKHALNRLIRTIPIVVGKRAATPEGATVSFHITGAVQRAIACTITNGRGTVSDGVATDALVTITLDSATFFQLATGRVTADESKNKWSITGDKDLGYRVVSQLNMMI
ncbi:MAG: maleylpyruvate isomerase family mycothiol-dependent enzyme [Ilumatobacteraceae bacterium]|nr:maleylpyruvate isomerase family mycothiol-dependent enzyme [Ilumatobacteraceae bacterium]